MLLKIDNIFLVKMERIHPKNILIKTVTGIEMLSISETAGLGMKAKEADFKDQFKDKNVEKFTYTKTGESGDDMIDAISGATITTNAVTNAVDSALVYFQNELGGGSNE